MVYSRAVAQASMRAALAGACALVWGCATTPEPFVDPRLAGATVGQEIVIAGERFAIGTPVVLWFEEPGYSAYDTLPRFASAGSASGAGDQAPTGLRFRPGREGAGPAPDRTALNDVVDQFVLHYDACGLSRTCFRVLQDERGLSVHFLLDVDGTLYQTMDLADTAWHAHQANPRSVGIEIANIGAYSPDRPSPLDRWYDVDDEGLRLRIPDHLGDGGVRTPGFVARPARPGRIRGEIQGELFEQVDLTPEQYESLAHLTAALVRAFPRLAFEFPRGSDGRVLTSRLPPAAEAQFSGILGHYHVSATKRDPGPAFDWERLQADVVRLLP